MTYCSTISVSSTFSKNNSVLGFFKKKSASNSKPLSNFTSAGKVSGFDWTKFGIGFMVALNLILGAGYAVLINQATIGGYRLARAESQKQSLMEERMKLSVVSASQQASESKIVEGFEPVVSMEYLGKTSSEQLSLR